MHITWNTCHPGWFYCPFENKYNIFGVEVVSDLAYELFYCVDIAVNQILNIYGYLVQWHCGWSGGGGGIVPCCRLKQLGPLVQWHCDCLFWESQTTDHNKTPTKYGILVQCHWNCFFRYFKWLNKTINRFIWNKHVFWV